jgi:undecaprenyl-diphosphatase
MLSATARRRMGDADLACSERLRGAVDGRGIVRWLAIFAARSADSWLVLLVLVSLRWFAGAAIGRPALILAIAVVATAVFVRLLKRVIGRDRPEAEWGGSYRRADPHSFPSGHAARVGTIAAFAALVWPAPAALALVLWAAAVAAARVALGVHYVSDVVVGLALGTTIGIAIALLT